MPENPADYILDTPYPHNFTKDQSPAFLNHVARLRGLDTVALDQPFTYCELACGPGLTSVVLAAALPQGDFYAIDLNPDHIAEGRRLAAACRIPNITFIESSFARLLDEDLPRFDFITMQGTYSWLSAEARLEVRRTIDRFLKPAGLVYLHCAILPGCLPYYPLKEILRRRAPGLTGGSRDKAARGLALLEELRDGKAAYFQANPSAGQFLDMMRARSLEDVAHELFNEWNPQFFSDIAAEMAEFDLHYCGSTKFRMNFIDKGMPKRFRSLVEHSVDDETAAEDLKSLVVNERSRRDVYARRAPAAGRGDPLDSFAEAAFLSPHPEPLDIATMRPRYAPVVRDLLPEIIDGTRSLAEICACPSLSAYSGEQILDAVHELTAVSQLWPIPGKAPARGSGASAGFRIPSTANRALLEDRVLKDPHCTLASTHLGNGIAIGPIPGLLILSVDTVGLENAPEQALSLLEASGKTWVRDDKPVSGRNDRLRLFEAELRRFRDYWIPVLHRLGIIEQLPARPVNPPRLVVDPPI